MRSQDIINHIAIYLPKLVDDFTTQISVDSLTRSGTTATATTLTPHGLSVGEHINVTGAQTPIEIQRIERNGIVATMYTKTPHDFTENAGFDVQVSGSSDFDGVHKLLSVPNRQTVTFQVDDSGAFENTGGLLLNASNVFQRYDGLKEITAVTPTTFEFTVPDGIYTPAHGTIVAKTNPRISSAVDFDRILDSYTKQKVDQAWLFVVIGDAIANNSRKIDTDSTDNIQSGNFFDQRLIQNVQLFVILPTTGEISGRKARDRCQELLSPICQSIVGVKFPSLVENNNNPLMITGHGAQAYNTAFYAHQYAFEATLQMGETDIFRPTDDVAFRDIDLEMGLDIGTETFDTLIDLDDQAYDELTASLPLGMSYVINNFEYVTENGTFVIEEI